MRPRWRVFAGVAALAGLALACGGGGGGGGSGDEKGAVVVRLASPSARGAARSAVPPEVTRIAVSCTGDDMAPVSGDLPLDGSALVLLVDAGPSRLVTAEAFAGAVLRMRGETEIGYVYAGGESTATISLVDQATLTLTPGSAEVRTGETAQFQAVVAGHADTTVLWSVNGVSGGNAAVGTISAAGLYTAPSAVPDPAVVTVRAASREDPTLYQESRVTVLPPALPVTVAVSPGAVTLRAGTAQQFQAAVTGTADTAVLWFVNGVAGGNGSVGTIGASGLYAAPAAVPSPPVVTVRAVSVADASAYGEASVTVVETPTLTLTPGSAEVRVGETVPFQAVATGLADPTVLWSVNGVSGGNATVGTVSAAGLYTAPSAVPDPAVVTVRAASREDPTLYREARVTVLPPAVPVTVTISPGAPRLLTGGTQQFSAAVTGTADTAVLWFVNGVAGGNASVGTISASGLYTAPAAVPAPPVVTVRAVSVADASAYGEASVTVVEPPTLTLTPGSAEVTAGETVQFQAVVTGLADPTVLWSVNGVSGGNAAVGTISAAGLYTAPSAVPDPAVVTVRAASREDPTLYREAGVTVLPPAVPVTVAVAPGAPRLLTGGTQQFSAAVTGTPDTAVLWFVNGVAGGNASVGTISASGLYTAPAAVAGRLTVTVKAQSVAEAGASASADLTILSHDGSGLLARYSNGIEVLEGPVFNGWEPSWGCVETNHNLYQGVCTPVTSSPVDWASGNGFSVTWEGYLYAPVSGRYHFSSSYWVDGVIYASVDGVVLADFNTVGRSFGGDLTLEAGVRVPVVLRFTANGGSNNMQIGWVPPGAATWEALPRAYLEPPVHVTVTPASAEVDAGGSQRFSATVAGASGQAVTWFVDDVEGGNVTVGTVDASGLYSAPAAVPTPPVVTVRAVSAEDASAFGEASVTVRAPRQAGWARTYSAGANVTPCSLEGTPDGGFILGGNASSYVGSAWIARLDAAGRILWQQSPMGRVDTASTSSPWLPPTEPVYLKAVRQTPDGGFVALGSLARDCWVARLDAAGQSLWERVLGQAFPFYGSLEDVRATSDGGYLLVGRTEGALSSDVWVVKLDAQGEIQWQEAVGGANEERGLTGRETPDGGFVVVGWSHSFNDDSSDVWVVKLSATGALEWHAGYGGTSEDDAADVVVTPEGDVVVVGTTRSYGAGGSDLWVLRLDASGALKWQRAYGGAGTDEGLWVDRTSDSGFIVGGDVQPAGWGRLRPWLVRLDGEGNALWTKTYGDGSGDVELRAGTRTADGGYALVAGFTNSLLLKTDSGGGIATCALVADEVPTVTASTLSARPFEAAVASTSATSVPVALETRKAYVTSTGQCPTPCVTVSPVEALVEAGSWELFSATVIGGTSLPVSWAVEGVIGGGAQTGTIDAAGLYVAPAEPLAASVTVTATVEGDPPASDAAVVRVARRVPTWSKTYGGTQMDGAVAGWPTHDGGYVVAGTTSSFGAGQQDAWVLKLNRDGTPAWQKSYGGFSKDVVNDFRLAADGGYVLVGQTYSFGGNGGVWVVKLGAEGEIEWQKVYGGPGDTAYTVLPTADGGYVVGGAAGNRPAWVLKLGADGTVEWGREFPTALSWGMDAVYALERTADGGCVLGGTRRIVWGVFSDTSQQWVARLAADGTLLWSRAYYYGEGEVRALLSTSDGGLAAVGSIYDGSEKGDDVWIVKLGLDGSIWWSLRYGRPAWGAYETATGVVETADGGLAVAGVLRGVRDDSFNPRDLWLVRLDAGGGEVWQKTYGGPGYPTEPGSLALTPDGGFLLTAQTSGFYGGAADVWVLRLDEHGEVAEGCDLARPSSVPTVPLDIKVLAAGSIVDKNVTAVDTAAAVTDTTAAPSCQCARPVDP